MKKNIIGWSGFVLLLIITASIFVRAYRFDDWLYFKMDQSRDAFMITNAVENGPQYLPLLGARAGAVKLDHGFLRLGPIFYYFQYLSGVIFHSTQPYVYAYPDLFFSVLAIPMLYLLVRRFFSKRNSLFIVAMYAFSFIIIQYSRFAWNPNSLQFFQLVSFYGLLRFLNEPVEKRKKWWLAMWATGMTIGSQLHFFGFFSLVGISGLVVLAHFRMWESRQWAAVMKRDVLRTIFRHVGTAALVFFVFYAPVFISDVYRGGENTRNFFEAIGSKPADKPLSQKLIKDITENVKYYCLITTSQCYDGGVRKHIPAIVATALIMLSGVMLVIRGLLSRTLDRSKRDFLFLLVAWVTVFTVLTIPVSFQLRPRFFIVVFAIPFISVALLFEYLEEKVKPGQALAFAFLVTAGIIAWNTTGTYAWFREQAESQNHAFDVQRTLILKVKDGVTLGELQGVTDWMYERHRSGAALYYYVKPEHVRPVDYLLYLKHDSELRYATMSEKSEPEAQFFAITPADSGIDAARKKFGDSLTVVDSAQFGQLVVSELDYPGRSATGDRRFNRTDGKSDRVFWKDVFGVTDTDSAIRIDASE
ncbi:MAG TPA: phospholipid carrier-dependent glycosyltransferase [Candidatus Fimivivens sp.]|nr:phospholipid carrier-dependent glycosyltransferase [Candidatus Fimivivens sp.]